MVDPDVLYEGGQPGRMEADIRTTRASKKRREVLSRYALITQTKLSISRNPEARHSSTLSAIEFLGQLKAPVRDLNEISLYVFQEREFTPDLTSEESHRLQVWTVGAFTSLRPPRLQASISLLPIEFERLWVLAAAQRIACFYLSCDAPYRNSSLIRSVSFDTDISVMEDE